MKNTKLQLIRLNSDNFDNEFLTPDAYAEVRLQMSSGDFGSHKINYVEFNNESEFRRKHPKATIVTLWDVVEDVN